MIIIIIIIIHLYSVNYYLMCSNNKYIRNFFNVVPSKPKNKNDIKEY